MNQRSGSPIPTTSRWRHAALPLLAAGGMAGALVVGVWLLHDRARAERVSERDVALDEVAILVGQARRQAAYYVQGVNEQRGRAEEALARDTDASAERIASRIASAFEQARLSATESRLSRVEQQRNDVARMLIEQKELIEKYRQTLTAQAAALREEARKAEQAKRDAAEPDDLPSLLDLGRASEVDVVALPEPGTSATAAEPDPKPSPEESLPRQESRLPDDLPLSEPDPLLETPSAGSLAVAAMETDEPAGPTPVQILASIEDSLVDLLPQSGSFSLVDPAGKTILARSRGPAGADMPEHEVRRAIALPAAGERGLWTLSVRSLRGEAFPEPNATELARLLEQGLGVGAGGTADLLGAIVSEDGRILQTLPAGVSPADLLTVPQAGVWHEVEAGGMPIAARMELAQPASPCPWTVAVQVVLDDPDETTRMWSWLESDWRLGLLAGGMLLCTVAVAGLAVRRLTSSAPAGAPRAARRAETARPSASAEDHDPRVVLAEMGAGGMRVRRLPRRKPHHRALASLQALHRGSASAGPYRVLDRARSPVLRELVRRVRPLASRRGGAVPGAPREAAPRRRGGA